MCDVCSLLPLVSYVMPFWYAIRYTSVVASSVIAYAIRIRHTSTFIHFFSCPLYIRLQAVPHKQLVLSVAAFLRERELGTSFLETLPGLDVSELLDPLEKV
jgi:hypothetical protein